MDNYSLTSKSIKQSIYRVILQRNFQPCRGEHVCTIQAQVLESSGSFINNINILNEDSMLCRKGA